MADIPVARSYAQILGAMITAFRAKYGMQKFKVGGPLLSIMEGAAQSDLRSTKEIFTTLAATSLDTAEGTALDRIAADEGTERQGASPSSGYVTISDTRYTKIASTVFSGTAAPAAGVSTINIVSNASFPASGQIYIGRGTANYEGPLTYDSRTTNPAGYTTLNLNTNFRPQKNHNVGESVILAQGGNRTINAGTIAQTPQSNSSLSAQFSVLYPATIADGEVSIAGVQVTCTQPGTVGNIPANSISSFRNAPFQGAVATNPLPFNNGMEEETDQGLRERIRNLRQSRTKGTDLAIKTNLVGTTASDENKRVVSANVVSRQGYPTVVYIDDGSGYEEITDTVATETLTDSAMGGEKYFQLALGRPVAKAFAKTTVPGPYVMQAGATLTVLVGSLVSTHTFSADDFRSLQAATTYEIVASINANADINFSARTSDNGTTVTIFAKQDSGETIEVKGGGANDVLLFSQSEVQTLRLYKNDVLLSKDGKLAQLVSNPVSQWNSMVSGEDLYINVDGTGEKQYIFYSQDFVNANTGYTILSSNAPLTAWAAVINSKIPGVTASVNNGLLLLTSNRGATSSSSLQITRGSLVTKKMFSAGTSVGAANDYTLNRNTGQLCLTNPLVAGDRLMAGTPSTRAFVESRPITGFITVASPGKMWVAVDGGATVIPTTISGSTTLTVSASNVQGNQYVTVTGAAGTFSNVKQGDWAIIWDKNFTTKSMYRVATASSTAFSFETLTWAQTGSVATSGAGITFVRSLGRIYEISIAASNFYTAQSLAAAINAGLSNAFASVVRTNRLRITTTTYGSNGSVMLVAKTDELSGITLPVRTVPINSTPHLASRVSGNSQVGTPLFKNFLVTTTPTSTTIPLSSATGWEQDRIIVGLKSADRSSWTVPAFGSGIGYNSSARLSGTTLYPRVHSTLFNILDRLYPAAPYNITYKDDLSVVLDGDPLTKQFTTKLARKVTPVGSYNSTVTLKDADGGNAYFYNTFGTFDFNDFALMMPARCKSNPGTTSEITWRYTRIGKDGNNLKLSYEYPTAPNQSPAVSLDPYTYSNPRVSVSLNSGAARTLTGFGTTNRVGVVNIANAGNSNRTTYIVLGLTITAASRTSNVTTVTLQMPDAISAGNGFQVGDQISVEFNGTATGFTTSSGIYTLTAVTSTTVSFADVNSDASVSSGSFGFVTASTVSGATFGNAQANDVVSINSLSGVRSDACNRGMRVMSVVQSNHVLKVTSPQGPTTADTAITWSPAIGSTSYLQVYPVGMTAAALVSAIGTSNPIVKPVLTSAGTATIAFATWDAQGDRTYTWPFTDGVNWVGTTNAGTSNTDYTFDLKNAVDTNLAAGCDWANEECYLVPTTAKNVADYLNALSVSGLSNNGAVEVSENGKVQITTATPGSTGSVEITGGWANGAWADVRGAGSVTSDGLASYCHIYAAEVGGFQAGGYVRIANTQPYQRQSTLPTAVLNTTTTGTNTLTFGTAIATAAYSATGTWQVEPEGKYGVYLLNGALSASAYEPGDYVTISGFSTQNNGTYLIVAINAASNTVWVENPNATTEVVASGTLKFTLKEDPQPGDKLLVGNAAWGFTGAYTIATVGTTTVTLVESIPSGTPGIAGGSTVQVIAPNPAFLVKRIRAIIPHPTDSTLMVMVFEDIASPTYVSEVLGSTLTALDKLAFPTGAITGADGYAYNVGLIGEANKILYGDQRDQVTYPGVVASGSYINISGPIVKRVYLDLAIRFRSGATKSATFAAVRSAVASVVNSSKVGESIPLSKIVSAANAVGGVLGVTVVSPTYNTGSDLVVVQPHEKALVVDLESDIQLSVLGA